MEQMSFSSVGSFHLHHPVWTRIYRGAFQVYPQWSSGLLNQRPFLNHGTFWWDVTVMPALSQRKWAHFSLQQKEAELLTAHWQDKGGVKCINRHRNIYEAPFRYFSHWGCFSKKPNPCSRGESPQPTPFSPVAQPLPHLWAAERAQGTQVSDLLTTIHKLS